VLKSILLTGHHPIVDKLPGGHSENGFKEYRGGVKVTLKGLHVKRSVRPGIPRSELQSILGNRYVQTL